MLRWANREAVLGRDGEIGAIRAELQRERTVNP
jgi:hypothetical protein